MYALVDCNNFYASCERVFAPGLRKRPLVILSNNDGCIVSRSQEAKDLGLPMGGPVFEHTALLTRHAVAVQSSNYVLYGDMSRRVMEVIRGFTPYCELYSIDEAFLFWEKVPSPILDYGARIKETIYRWTGIPVSVGFGASKTLAKAANRLAKQGSGVCLLRPEDRTALASLPVSKLWGVGRRSTQKLAAQKIETAYDLQQANDEHIRRLMTVCGQRTVFELRGTPCIKLEEVRRRKQEICCTRSFGKMLSEASDLREAVVAFTTRAAEKLREDGSVAGSVHVCIETNGHRQDLSQYAGAVTTGLPVATAYTPALIAAALRCLDALYKPGYRYKRAGVLLLDLCPKDRVQQNLFDAAPHTQEEERLMTALDRINTRWGRHTLVAASMGVREAHRMNQQRLSPCYTTRWEDVMAVKT